jgi:hypothetical protein
MPADLANALNGLTEPPIGVHDTLLDGHHALGPAVPLTDFKEVKGQEVAKHAMEVARQPRRGEGPSWRGHCLVSYRPSPLRKP